MHHNAGRGINCQRCSIHDTVVCLDKLHPELPHVDGLSKSYDFSLGSFGQFMLLQLILNNSHGKPGGINGYVHLPKHIGKRSNVVFMTVRNHKPFHLVDIVFQISHIRNDKVYSQHIVCRE